MLSQKLKPNFFQILILISLSILGATSEDKICAYPGSIDLCETLGRTGTYCKPLRHGVDCLLEIERNTVQFGVVGPEEAFLGANLISSNVQVIGEIINYRHPNTESVVVIHKNITDDKRSTFFDRLKGHRLCHPGFKHDTLFSNLMLRELDSKILDLYKNKTCGRDNGQPGGVVNQTTLVEREVEVLSSFWKSACRPGAWTQSSNLDSILKMKYSNLCAACEGNAGCDTDYVEPFKNALQCLEHDSGDVAFTTLELADGFFKNQTNKDNYLYFCKNGTVTTWDRPCVWTKQLPKLIVANRNSAENWKIYIGNNLSDKLLFDAKPSNLDASSLSDALSGILKMKQNERLSTVRRSVSLTDYVKEVRSVPKLSDGTRCPGSNLKWCTNSAVEQAKCEWLSQAALNRVISPSVECVRSEKDDKISCLESVSEGITDIVVSSTDYGYISLKKDLSALAYPETDTRNLSQILLVKRANDASIKNFGDLRGKKACLPEYGGKEFLAFIDNGRKLGKMENKNCNYGQILSDFVGESCVAGANDLLHEITNETKSDKLCALCKSSDNNKPDVYCNANQDNNGYGNLGALRCLRENGDFAVITKMSQYEFEGNATNLQVICKNGNLANADLGLNVPKDCPLNTLNSGEIVSRWNNTKNPDILIVLKEFERWFGQDQNKPFHLFNIFNGTKNVLFMDSTPGLDFTNTNQYVNNYVKLIQNTKQCESKPDSGTAQTASIILTLFSIVILQF